MVFESHKRPLGKYFLFCLGFLFLIGAVLAGLAFAQDYLGAWEKAALAEQEAERLRDLELAYERLRLRDDVGGSTPKDTLRLFVDRLDAGDLEKGAAYFVVEKQELWLEKLEKLVQTNQLGQFARLVRRDLIAPGKYSASRNVYTISAPLPIEFILYPKGIWKIQNL